jgi:ComF family protein
VTAAYAYDFPVDALIQAYKYGGELRLARLLGRALAHRASAAVDALVPMPLSVERLRSRGYNQALELAREVGRVRGVPVWAHACRRVIDTPAQALLPWRERPRNVLGAFVCDADLAGLRVAVVDDVLTTGATLNELARNLRRAGAAEVHGWVAARAVQRVYKRRDEDYE